MTLRTRDRTPSTNAEPTLNNVETSVGRAPRRKATDKHNTIPMIVASVAGVSPIVHMELGAGEDEQTQLVPFDLRPPTKSHNAKWCEGPNRASFSARVLPHVFATNPHRQRVCIGFGFDAGCWSVVWNRHSTHRSVNKLTAKMDTDNLKRLSHAIAFSTRHRCRSNR